MSDREVNLEKENNVMNKPGRAKKLAGLIIGMVLLLGIDFLVFRSAGNMRNVFSEIGKMKMGLLFLCNIVFLVILFAGDRICARIKKTSLYIVLEWMMLLLTPPVLLVSVQVIMSLCLNKVPAKASLVGMLERVLWMEPGYILKNLLICYLILLILILLVRKINIACGICCLLLVAAALVDFYVVQFRGQAFLLLDILGMGTAAEVVGGYQFQIPVYMGILMIGLMCWTAFQMKLQKLTFGKKGRKNLLFRLAGLFMIAAVLVCTVPGWWKTEKISLWNVNKEYLKKGYLYMLAGEGKYFSVEKPDGYSIEEVDQIVEKTEKEYSERTSTDTSEKRTQPVNIIMIMNESLADLESVGKIKTDSEILPFIRSLDQNVKSGQLHVPTYGGGTARTEYEALTGNAMHFLPAGSVPYQTYIRDPEYGMADILKEQGYETVAMHPNKAANWNRTKVYPSMGFDQFVSIENWGDQYRETMRGKMTDKSTYDKIISLYDEKDKGQKLFTFCVTMQNHGGYTKGTLDGYEPTVKLHYKKEYPQAETYLSVAKESDQAFKDLLEYFEKVEEPTMIIMFGDHWPAVEDEFLSKVIGKDKDNLDLVESQVLYTTPYVIWTNYSSETVKQDISSNYLGSYILEQAGVELPAYNKFLLNLKDQIPVIGIDALEDKDGNWYSMEALPEEYQELMKEYSILQYNDQFEKKQIKEEAFRVSDN